VGRTALSWQAGHCRAFALSRAPSISSSVVTIRAALTMFILPNGYYLVIKTDDLHFYSFGQTRYAMARFCTPSWHCGQAGSTRL
jgi:hypothetical protein